MTDDQFWVNTDGLAQSAGGFHDKAATVNSLVDRVKALSSPDLAAIVGLDSQGEGVFQQLQQGSTQLHQGLSQWGEAIHNAGDSVANSAKVFDKTEDNSKKLAGTMDRAKQDLPTFSARDEAATPRLALARTEEEMPVMREGDAIPAERERVEAPLMREGVAMPLERVQAGRPAERDSVPQTPRLAEESVRPQETPRRAEESVRPPEGVLDDEPPSS